MVQHARTQTVGYLLARRYGGNRATIYRALES